MDFIQMTEQLFRWYLQGSPEDTRRMLNMMDSGCVYIGTGCHEIYHSRAEFAKAAMAIASQQDGVRFHFQDVASTDTVLSENLHLVTGIVTIRWDSGDRNPCTLTVPSRFSVLYQFLSDAWKIVHIHLSVPFQDQDDEEYYPKSLALQMKETQEIVEQLREQAQKDSLTGLINLRTLEQIYTTWHMRNAWLVLVDLDDFKLVNDTYGHVEGNHVLKKLAEILRSNVRSQDAVSRLGGDEFVILCSDLSRDQIRNMLGRMLENIRAERKKISSMPTISMGAVRIRRSDSLEESMRRADKEMYVKKKEGKNGFIVG